MSPVFFLQVANFYLICHVKRRHLIVSFCHIVFLANQKNEAVSKVSLTAENAKQARRTQS